MSANDEASSSGGMPQADVDFLIVVSNTSTRGTSIVRTVLSFVILLHSDATNADFINCSVSRIPMEESSV